MLKISKIDYQNLWVGDNSQFEPLLIETLSHFNKLMEAYQLDSKEEYE